MLNVEDLKSSISYCDKTGEFRWIVNTGHVKSGDLAGCIAPSGYLMIGLRGGYYRAHRLAWLYVYGEFPLFNLDHTDHDRLNNKIENLRQVSQQENSKNKSMPKNNTSGFTGVNWHKQSNKWRSRINTLGNEINLGLFEKIEDAVKARNVAIEKYKFHKNHGVKV